MTNPYLSLDQKIVGDIYTSPEAMDNLSRLCDDFGSRFGGIPRSLPELALPPFSWDSAKQLLIPTLTIALLGAIESLLCARIADNVAEDLPRHDPNQELMAQGIASISLNPDTVVATWQRLASGGAER